ncbi:hypothetical protein KKE34_00700 [Patescibacteria group bacterium]|nr:hypothetical protein [Patescibacteria group bacterium]MBU1885108.1 hypothetical protein [Patescibacteria group bacterium]
MIEGHNESLVELKEKESSRKNNLAILLLSVFLLMSLFLNAFFISANRNGKEDQVKEVPDELEQLSDDVIEGQDRNQNTVNQNTDEYDYLLKELYLLKDRQEFAESQLFGFRFNQFHKDWKCENIELQYTASGITIVCRQKPCSLSEGVRFPTAVNIERSQACSDELEEREFPRSILSSFNINVSPVYLEHEQVFADVENFIPNKITPKSHSYQFNVIKSNNKRETGYIKQYEVVFYSPKTISDLMSNYTGMLYGSEDIYAKYHIIVDVYEAVEQEKELAEEKFLGLINKMIDSIEFFE